MDTKIVTVEWDGMQSIRNAERKKAFLEMQGYKLVKTICGFTQSTLIYKKEA